MGSFNQNKFQDVVVGSLGSDNKIRVYFGVMSEVNAFVVACISFLSCRINVLN